MKTVHRKVRSQPATRKTLSESNYFLHQYDLSITTSFSDPGYSLGPKARAAKEHFDLFPSQNCQHDSSNMSSMTGIYLGFLRKAVSKSFQGMALMTGTYLGQRAGSSLPSGRRQKLQDCGALCRQQLAHTM
jgi:hypothetical protein